MEEYRRFFQTTPRKINGTLKPVQSFPTDFQHHAKTNKANKPCYVVSQALHVLYLSFPANTLRTLPMPYPGPAAYMHDNATLNVHTSYIRRNGARADPGTSSNPLGRRIPLLRQCKMHADDVASND
jgi:hypothetical protein